MSAALEDANKEVETILAAAVAENGKGVLQSGLDLDSDGNVSGYLMKKGEGGFMSSAKMKRRYFCLKENILYYYKEDAGQPQGNIDLNTAFKVDLTNVPEKGPRVGDPYIAIHTPTRKWVLSGPLEVLIKWAATLKFCTKDTTQQVAEATSKKKAMERKKKRGSVMSMMVSFSRFNTGGEDASARPPGTLPAKQYSLTFDSGPLYLDLIADDDDNIKVSGFAETPDGNPGPAEKSGEIKEGDYLLGCNETSFEDLGFYDSIDVIKAAGYPKEFLFEHPPVEPKPDLEGWFGKKGEKNNSFRRRYFKLYGSTVFYYKPTMVDINLPNAKPIGSVDLKTVTKITPVINENYGVHFKKNTLELETEGRAWVFGFLDEETMVAWGKAIESVSGRSGTLQEAKRIEKSETGNGNKDSASTAHNTFMLKFVVPAEATAGCQLEVTDPYDRKIRVTVPDDLASDRVMLVPIEAPSISNQEKLLSGGCTRKCWFSTAYRQRFYDIYGDRILLKRSEDDSDGTPLFFGELNAISKKVAADDDVEAGGEGRLLFTTSSKDYQEIGFASKEEMENAFTTLQQILVSKFKNCAIVQNIVEPKYQTFAADEENEEVDDVKAGWMWKKGQTNFIGASRNAYRRRWFALRHNELMYFKYQKANKGFGTGTHDTAGRAGVIDMSQVEHVEVCMDDGCADNTIVVKALNRSYFLVVPGTDDDFDDWFKCLSSAVDVYGGEGGAEALEAVRKKEVEAEANRVAAIKATFKKSGVLSKKELAFGGTLSTSSFSARYFVLDAESLSYYKSEQEVYNADNDAYGSVPTKSITSIVYPSKEKGAPSTSFDLCGKNGIKWIIDAGSFGSAKDWITALTKDNGLQMQIDDDSIKTVVTKAQLGNRMDFYGAKKKKGKKKKKIGGRGKRSSIKTG